MAFTVSCRKCNKRFKTGYSAQKHHNKSHANSDFNGGIFKDSHERPLTNEPTDKQLGGEELASYKTWLTLLTEQITGSLNPNAKGKTWERLETLRALWSPSCIERLSIIRYYCIQWKYNTIEKENQKF